ncbi:MAG: hypothetical protein QGF74_00110 [Candidatus Nanoarchaeia archaeon]|jgi:hypothetical protein|nr:hypothetical protein [Candidatus Nanoarchaeia archaeon]|tara:strand:- start:13863 stop:14153 length:291 start_codon:yes stop_codon:yes gene_type:complete
MLEINFPVYRILRKGESDRNYDYNGSEGNNENEGYVIAQTSVSAHKAFCTQGISIARGSRVEIETCSDSIIIDGADREILLSIKETIEERLSEIEN